MLLKILKCSKMKYCFNNCRSDSKRMRVLDLYSCQTLAIDRIVFYTSVSVKNCQFEVLNSFITHILSKTISLDPVLFLLCKC